MKLKLVREDLDPEETMETDADVETVRELLDEIEVSAEEVLVARNGTIVSSGTELEEGDTVRVMDVIAGG